MPFRWTINPYRGCTHACAYCFARPTHKYLDLSPGRDFEREIVVKVNAPEVARAELSRPRWKREHVAMGTNTDPYQWVESKYRLMPGILEALRDSGTPASVLTKSPLLLRDMELMKQVPEFQANLSVPTLEEKAWRVDRAAHAAPAQAARGGRRAEPQRHPLRHPDRAADSRRERLAGAGRRDHRDRHRGRRHQHRRDRAAPARGGQGAVVRVAARAPARPDPAPTSGSTAAAPTCRPAERERLSALARGGRPQAALAARCRPWPAPGGPQPEAEKPAQSSLF